MLWWLNKQKLKKKGYIMYKSMYTKFLKRQNSSIIKKNRGVSCLRGCSGRTAKRARGSLTGRLKCSVLLSVIIQMYTLVKYSWNTQNW